MPVQQPATLNHPVVLDRLAHFCALAVLLVGLLVLAGWALKLEALKSVLPGFASMKPNAALGMVLAGIALAQRRRSGLRLGCAAALIGLGGVSLAQDLSGADFGVDQLLFRDLPDAAQTASPGRMSPITAINLILLGGALALLGSRRVTLHWALEALALVALALSLPALIGYAYGTQSFYPLPGFSSMALPTALALSLLAIGILCARADGLAGVFANAGLGGQVARRLLPLALIAPVLLGWFAQLGENAGLFNLKQDIAVFAAAMMLVLVALIGRIAQSLEASDAERQRAEGLQAQLAADLSSLYATAPVGLFMFDTDLRFVRVNRMMAELNRQPAELHIGRTLREVLAPELADAVEPQLRQVLATGQPVLNSEAPGACVPQSAEQRCWLVSYHPVQAADGTITGVHGAVQDITERKQAEQALRESEAFSRSILKSSPDCVKVLDLEGNLLSMQSGQELLGIEDIQPFLNKSWLEFWTGKNRQAAQAAVEAAVAGGAGKFVGYFRTLRGEAKWWEVLISPILDAHDKPARLLAVSRDVTQRQQAEAVLRQRSAQFETLVNEAPLGIYLIDADFRVRQVNPTALAVFGNISELIGRDFAEVMHIAWPEAQANVVVKRFRHTLETGAAYFAPAMIELRADRQATEYYEWQINRIPLADGSHGVVCYFRDISERVLAQQKIAESEARYRSLFNSIDEGFCIIEMVFDEDDQAVDYRFLEVNPAFEQQTGLHHATGKRMRELNPDLETHWFEIYGKVALTGEAIRFSNEAKAMDGRWFDVYAFAHGGPQSRRVAILFNNITARKQAEQALGLLNATLEQRVQERTAELSRANADLQVEIAAKERLRESEERLLTVAENLSEGLVITTIEGEFIHWNRASLNMHGFASMAECLGQLADFTQLVEIKTLDGATLPIDQWPMSRALRGELVRNCELRIRRTDTGVERILSYGGGSVRDSVGKQSAFLIVTDIAERKRTEQQIGMLNTDLESRAAKLEEKTAELTLTSKYKSEFLANMSHELRTPLNSLLILSRLLADNRERNLTPQQVEFAETMHHAGSDLLRLINEILDLSRIEAGRVEVYVEAIVLAALRQRIERDFRHVAQSKQLDFSVSLDPQLPAIIRSDANRLNQVLKNLLANSFKFTAKGSVKLLIQPAADGWSRPHASLDRADGVIGFTVIDSGIGIAPDQQQLIFEAFAQADGTTSRRYGGTGLGLSISRELANLLGGAITLTSQAGAGSSFTLYLPYTYMAPCAAAPAKAEPSGRQIVVQPLPVAVHSAVEDDRQAVNSGDAVLLIVEYDPVFARLLVDIAHRHAFKGLVASTAAAALQLARQYQPMAITLSVTLPDMDGWTLLQQVSDDLGLRHIPVHIVSGEDERSRGLRRGAASCLQKPVSQAELGALFERIRAAKARAHSRLLVVEDDPAMQRQIAQAVGVGADVETTLVASAEQGLAELKARRYDCVVLDLRLPGMSGYEFLEAVRDELRIDDLPIVVYTGTELSTQQRARLRQLAESVLVKDARSLDRLLDQTSLYLHRRVAAMPEAARAALDRLHSADGMLAGTKVLVVDDDMRNIFALFAILEHAGIEARHAENGIQCMAILETSADFDAVLMDIMMPEMDGYETLRRIRSMKGREALPVIALTAKAMQGDREKCIEAGATDYLTKPVDPERLLGLLRYWIGP